MNIHVKNDIAQQFDPVLGGKNTPQHKLTGFKGFRKTCTISSAMVCF